MTNSEIRNFREVLANQGVEMTPDELTKEMIRLGEIKFQALKETFKDIKPFVEDIKERLDLGIITKQEFTKEVKEALNITPEDFKHLLDMNKVFDYES